MTNFTMPDSETPDPVFIPEYNRPDEPGIAMNFDNTVSIYQRVAAEDSFEQAVNEAFGFVVEAQKRYPGWPRIYYLEIDGHAGDRHGFDDDFFEFQQEFWFSTIAHFVHAFEIPIAGGLVNPKQQRNDLPDQLVLTGPGPGDESAA
jgi:hypothetical protein